MTPTNNEAMAKKLATASASLQALGMVTEQVVYGDSVDLDMGNPLRNY